MDEKAMGKLQIFLSKSQIRDVSTGLYEELTKMPLYDNEGRQTLISRYIGKVQETIRDNIKDFIRNVPEANANRILGRLFQDSFEDSLD
jgi:hypothetical protein